MTIPTRLSVVGSISDLLCEGQLFESLPLLVQREARCQGRQVSTIRVTVHTPEKRLSS
jgi:hypothetical protein